MDETTEIALWEVERGLWLDGAGAFAAVLAHEAVMVFAGVGLMRDGAIVDSLRDAPRWAEVEMSARETLGGEGWAVLAYRATARRAGAEPYVALCSSTYVQMKDRWRIVAHQQTSEGG